MSYTSMSHSSRFQAPKLPTINETSPLVLSEYNNNNNVDCESGRGYISRKSFFDRSFSYALCLGTVMIIAMLGLAFLAATHESRSPHSHTDNRHNNIHTMHYNQNHHDNNQNNQNQNGQHNSDTPTVSSTFLDIFK